MKWIRQEQVGLNRNTGDLYCLRIVSSKIASGGISQSRGLEAPVWLWFFTIFSREQIFKEYLCTQETHSTLSQALCPRLSISHLAFFHHLPHIRKGQVSRQSALRPMAEQSYFYLSFWFHSLSGSCVLVCVNLHLDGEHGPFAKVHFW